MPEIRKLLWHLALQVSPNLMGVIAWSLWRRRHQAVARACHYRRRSQSP